MISFVKRAYVSRRLNDKGLNSIKCAIVSAPAKFHDGDSQVVPTPVTASTVTQGSIVRLIGTSAGQILVLTVAPATTASPRTIARASRVS